MPGMLYVVGTPIGNLEDLTQRGMRVLGEVDLIAAEDTRVARKLLNYLGSKTRTLSFNEFNAHRRVPQVLEALREGDVAIVTDAGMPGVSDPGASLVAAAAAAGFRVAGVPGPSAVTTALAVSGMRGDSFRFLGFLPRTSGARTKLLEKHVAAPETLIAYEAPHRLHAALSDVKLVLGNRRIAVCRELTKLHEEVFRGVLEEAIEYFGDPRGEFVLVVEGAGKDTAVSTVVDTQVAEAMQAARLEGISRREAAIKVAATLGVPRRRAYQFWEAG